MSINQKMISENDRLNVLIRLLKNNELLATACSKSGLSISNAQQLLHKISYGQGSVI
jgi:hypothetical protein